MKILAKLVRSAKLTNFYRDYSKRVQFNKCVSLNVIGSGAFGESPSICLSVAKDENYLFNCGEDCHRLLNQFKIKISTIKHIFITQTKWNCIGGISGVGRTINSTSGWLPMLHGPKQLYKCIKRILCLSILSELDFRPIDCNFNRFYENDHLRIEFISIKLNKRCDIRDEHEVFIYVAKLKDEKSTGSKSKYRAHFMIIDLPTKDHLQSFLTSRFFKTTAQTFDIIVHFSPKSVCDLHEYQRLTSSLTTKKHLFLNETNEFSCLRSVYQLQEKLNGIDNQIHPPLRMPFVLSNKSCDLTHLSKEHQLEFHSKYYLTDASSFNGQHVDTNTSYQPQFQQTVDIKRLKAYPKIVFLGTVSASASLERNHTSILIHTKWNQSMLLDCGEGTCTQIARMYGKDAVNVIKTIRAVFISHLHFDHFGGLVELLRLRKKFMPADRSPLILLAPKSDLKSWLFFYDNTIDKIHDDLFLIDNNNLMTGGLTSENCIKLGIQTLQTCRVPHYNESYAVSLTLGSQKQPFKLTFSSDTAPCNDLISLGKNSNLLIHEATYPDDCIDLATKNRHCTVAQAIEQSQKMNAKYTMLTHFSKRYKFPQIDRLKYRNIGIAFDFMELTENDLSKLRSINEQYRNLSK